MVRILMCGSVASSGGVSTHTKNLIENLSAKGVEISFYNYYRNQIDSKNTNLEKVYRRTFGLFFQILHNRKKYEVIHDQTSGGIFSFISSITASVASKIVERKLIVTYHHSNTDFIKKYKTIFGFVLRNADTMILVSNKQKEFISKLFPEYCSKLTVIPNGFNPTVFFQRDQQKSREILGIPCNKKVIVNVSNLIELKGHKYLIYAVSEVLKENPEVICFVIGTGHCKEKLEKLIHQHHLENSLILVGWISNSEIPYWLSACDFFVFSSLREANPVVMFEAISCGRPFIGTNVGGVPEVITSEEYGLLCNPGDQDQLSKLIKIALNKRWDNNKIKEYSKQFSWETIAKRTYKVYTEF
jgi:teichuronic acid biosynthesis glycosyltransferase TuaC